MLTKIYEKLKICQVSLYILKLLQKHILNTLKVFISPNILCHTLH